MTREPNPHDQGAKVAAARQAAAAHASQAADRRIAERQRGSDGRMLARLSDDDWNDVLERVAAGDSDANIMRAYDLAPSAMAEKRRRDPAFAERFMQALEESFVTIARDIQHVTRGVPGHSSGDVRRDELIAKYDLELAKRFARRLLGDRVAIDATHSIAPVMLPTIALPAISEAEFTDVREDDAEL